jgi:prepilin-type N-terminal cleavage/methylation domain-containing protein
VTRVNLNLEPIGKRPCRFKAARGAFTLVEILIVVIMIGILATVVIPQLSSATKQTRENALKDELRYLRTQITVYKAQHQDIAPGYPPGQPNALPTAQGFSDQLTQNSDMLGDVQTTPSPYFSFGPYLSQVPSNPISGLSTIMMIPNNQPLPPTDGTTGWIYKAQTQEIIANLKGTDSSGLSFSSY